MKISFTTKEINQKQIQYLIDKDIFLRKEKQKIFEAIVKSEKEQDKNKEWYIWTFSNEELIEFLQLGTLN